MIHQYQLGDYNIVLDVCSGGLHVVDGLTYDIIAELDEKIRNGNETKEASDSAFSEESENEIVAKMEEKYQGTEMGKKEEIQECFLQVKGLYEAGKLFTVDTYEPMAGELKARTSGVVKALCLHIAHTCNLNCSYCFASQGKYHGDRAVMSFEVGKRALDFLVENSGSRRNLEVDFFGGEPLMNFQVVNGNAAMWCFPWTAEKRSTTVSVWTMPVTEAGKRSCRNSRSS